jgi:hypothetical protein
MTDPWRASKDVVHDMQDQLDHLRTASAQPAGRSAAEPPVGRGEALDGKIKVEATGGKVTALTIARPATHVPMPDLTKAIMEATNAALEAMRTAVVESMPTPPWVDQLTRALNEISSDSLRAMDKATEGVRQSMAAVQRISELHRGQR